MDVFINEFSLQHIYLYKFYESQTKSQIYLKLSYTALLLQLHFITLNQAISMCNQHLMETMYSYTSTVPLAPLS